MHVPAAASAGAAAFNPLSQTLDVTPGGCPHADVKAAPSLSDVNAQPCNFLRDWQAAQAVGVLDGSQTQIFSGVVHFILVGSTF